MYRSYILSTLLLGASLAAPMSALHHHAHHHIGRGAAPAGAA